MKEMTLRTRILTFLVLLGASFQLPVVQAFTPAQRGAPQAVVVLQAPSADVGRGAGLFRERCAECHGADAKGERGPNLTGLWTADASGTTDDRVFQTIRLGVPGSIMPPSQAPDEEIRAIVAYLRSFGTAGSGGSSAGNATNGERIFWSTCGGCHQVNGRGGYLGPDLTRIGGSQSREALARSIREASAAFTSGYEPMILVTRGGQQIRGARKSEDAFSIQIMDTHERLQGYLKADLRDVTRDKKSLMPDYGPDRLSDADFNDLLGFLSTLRSGDAGRPGRP
jgi:putative heme-binding domain-containing protein